MKQKEARKIIIDAVQQYLDKEDGFTSSDRSDVIEHLMELFDDSEFLEDLYAAGVDSWDGYEIAQNMEN